MKIVVKVVFNKFPQITQELRPKASRVVRETTLRVERRVKRSMAPPKSGREYKRAGGKIHKASAPGEAPAIDYGFLVNSIQNGMLSDLIGAVFTNADYGPHLEFGTAKMARRPFLAPGVEAEREAFIQQMMTVFT